MIKYCTKSQCAAEHGPSPYPTETEASQSIRSNAHSPTPGSRGFLASNGPASSANPPFHTSLSNITTSSPAPSLHHSQKEAPNVDWCIQPRRALKVLNVLRLTRGGATRGSNTVDKVGSPESSRASPLIATLSANNRHSVWANQASRGKARPM